MKIENILLLLGGIIFCIILCSALGDGTWSSIHNSYENPKVKRFVFEDHQYISFETRYNGPGVGVVHDPECRRCKE